MKKVVIGLTAAIVLISTAEIGIRMLGLVDFPLYNADSRIGYIPKPNQSGSFMNTNDWVFNELSMGTARKFQPSDRTDILLVGDSIVFGGNSYKQEERLGPQLEGATGDVVWPISAGSWGLQNELQYLQDHPDVVASVDRIILILNSADFDQPSSWISEFTHPREYPVSALCYLLERQIFKPKRTVQPETKVPARDAVAEFKKFAIVYSKPFDLWLYPTKAESSDRSEWEKLFAASAKRLEALDLDNVHIHNGVDILHFTDVDYRDNIHPTPAAIRKLAAAISESL